MAEYAIYVKDDGDGGLEVHSQIKLGMHRQNSMGAQAVEVAKMAIKKWLEEGGLDWGNVEQTSIISAQERLK
jgi:hypothetical protein